ncbi:MAG: response regulator transcription factor [Pyrinomonadaceae bacterium]
MKELRIVIAEDSAVLSKLIQRALSEIEGCNVVGTAADGVEALRLFAELKPHLLVLDISMPHKDGLEVLQEIRRTDSTTVIVMFTSDSPLRQLCLDAGANFFLDKSQLAELKAICLTTLLAG